VFVPDRVSLDYINDVLRDDRVSLDYINDVLRDDPKNLDRVLTVVDSKWTQLDLTDFYIWCVHHACACARVRAQYLCAFGFVSALSQHKNAEGEREEHA